MDRNVFRRVEVAFPILDANLKKRLIGDLDQYLSDNTKAWMLERDGSYRQLTPNAGEHAVSAQDMLLRSLTEGAAAPG